VAECSIEGEIWVNLKEPLVIEEEWVKERGSRTAVGNMISEEASPF
jgi:hypothetical protein